MIRKTKTGFLTFTLGEHNKRVGFGPRPHSLAPATDLHAVQPGEVPCRLRASLAPSLLVWLHLSDNTGEGCSHGRGASRLTGDGFLQGGCSHGRGVSWLMARRGVKGFKGGSDGRGVSRPMARNGDGLHKGGGHTAAGACDSSCHGQGGLHGANLCAAAQTARCPALRV